MLVRVPDVGKGLGGRGEGDGGGRSPQHWSSPRVPPRGRVAPVPFEAAPPAPWWARRGHSPRPPPSKKKSGAAAQRPFGTPLSTRAPRPPQSARLQYTLTPSAITCTPTAPTPAPPPRGARAGAAASDLLPMPTLAAPPTSPRPVLPAQGAVVRRAADAPLRPALAPHPLAPASLARLVDPVADGVPLCVDIELVGPRPGGAAGRRALLACPPRPARPVQPPAGVFELRYVLDGRGAVRACGGLGGGVGGWWGSAWVGRVGAAAARARPQSLTPP